MPIALDQPVAGDVEECPSQEVALSRPPSSPSNSWSSAETTNLQSDSPRDLDPADARRPKRCKISREQLSVLINSFEEEPLPNFDQRQAMAKQLGMTPRSVQIWFQNLRQRLKPMQPTKSSMAGMGMGGSAQQHLGMPGLAAAAGLCNGSTGGLESLVLGHAMSQQLQANPALQQAAMGYPHQMAGGHRTSSPSYDPMEPFAATKALLSAGYHPGSTSSLASLAYQQESSQHAQSRCSPSSLGQGAPLPGTLASLNQADPRSFAGHHGAPAPSSPKTEKADGLLLLLACADSGAGAAAVATTAEHAPIEHTVGA